MATDRHEILRRIDAQMDVPALPQVVSRLFEALDSETTSSQEIGDLAAQDPAIAARLLRSANSAIYACAGGEVRSVHEAVVRLGLREVRNVVLSLAVMDVFAEGRSCVNISDFWRHSLTAALAGGELARRAGGAVGSDEECFVAGLLHDVGVLVLNQLLGKEYARVVERAEREKRPLFGVEKEMLGIDHAEVGAALIRAWGLPEDVATATALHHRPAEAPEEHRRLVALVHLADWIGDHEGLGGGVDGYLGPFYEGAWDDLGLGVEVVPEVIEDFERASENSGLLITIAKPGGAGA